jgi:hypothetical protein
MPIIANCIQCGSEFQKRGSHVSCSKACADERRRAKMRTYGAASGKQPITTECSVCGSAFLKSCYKLTCSKVCAAELSRARVQAYKAAIGKRLLTADEVRALLAYEAETGVLRWLPQQGNDRYTQSWNARFAGKQAGWLNRAIGYWYVSMLGRVFLAHRLAWLIQTGSWPENGFDVDHVDGNPSNNTFANLRLASRAENIRNQKRSKSNSSGFKGVSLYRPNGKYRASIGVNGRFLSLGYFATPEEAHAA